jgi:hypothetical protein
MKAQVPRPIPAGVRLRPGSFREIAMKRIVLFLGHQHRRDAGVVDRRQRAGVNRFLHANGLNLGMLLVFAGSWASAAPSFRC